jgi:hypothetical protein
MLSGCCDFVSHCVTHTLCCVVRTAMHDQKWCTRHVVEVDDVLLTPGCAWALFLQVGNVPYDASQMEQPSH